MVSTKRKTNGGGKRRERSKRTSRPDGESTTTVKSTRTGRASECVGGAIVAAIQQEQGRMDAIAEVAVDRAMEAVDEMLDSCSESLTARKALDEQKVVETQPESEPEMDKIPYSDLSPDLLEIWQRAPKKFQALVSDLRLYYYNTNGTAVESDEIKKKLRHLATIHKLKDIHDYDVLMIELARREFFNYKNYITTGMWLTDLWRKNKSSIVVAGLMVCGGLALAGAVFAPVASRLLATTAVAAFATAGVVQAARAMENDVVVKYDTVLADLCTADLNDVVNTKISSLCSWSRSSSDKCAPKAYPVGFTIAKERVWIPRMCIHNEEVAVVTRQLLPTIGDAATRRQKWRHAFQYLAETLYGLDSDEKEVRIPEVVHWPSLEESRQQYLDHLPSAARSRWLAAESRHHMETVTGRSKAFIKKEVLLHKTFAKHQPRLISGKTDEYLVATGPTYYGWQKRMIAFHWPNLLEELIQQPVIYSGGLDPIVLGQLVSHFESLGWYVYEGDFSRYDGHTEMEALESEFDFYQAHGCTITDSLSMQLVTTGSLPLGTSFKTKGKRASGVINTTMGNTLCGLAMLNYYLGHELKLAKHQYCVVQLGDDNIIFCEEDIETSKITEFMEHFGHVLEIVRRGNDTEAYDTLEYCSSVFWDIGEHRVLGPKIFRVLSKSFVPTASLSKELLSGHIAGVAQSMKHYMFLPVLDFVCGSILKHHKIGKICSDVNPHKIQLKTAATVDPVAVRRHFIQRYHLLPEDFVAVLKKVDWSKVGTSVSARILTDAVNVDGVGSDESYDFTDYHY